MKPHGYSEEEIFRVDKPIEALKALCAHREELLSWDSLRDAYEKANQEKVSPDYASVVGMFFNQFGLIEKASVPNKYRITSTAKELCQSLARGDKSRYKELLSRALLSQELKSRLFRRFLAFLGKPRTISEVNRGFERKGTTLRAWCEEAGLIAQKRELLWNIKPSIRSTEEFWRKFTEIYESLTRTRVPGLRSPFAKISDAKRYMLPYLPAEEENAFDKGLTKVLREPKYKSLIELSGSPVSYVEREKLEPFVHNGRKYYFISILTRRD